ncbi:antibiotic biosynthesis monooxygenase [Brevibacillus fluminis]|uniref:Antibiotic biosynthesis monooxygenase n=1 Tax=Brevibacillus fluminis TaxID=511487 RepID=A0A3M8CVF0_9BACL|nr:putative quinol monooxygenase [Brevibacillus fluminis]RNB79588.1 antibiotic biosynthesis monooxygenase [Brevibacillus fluminis]
MLMVHVYFHVKEEHIEAFREATLENARNSIQEPGVARFDALRQQDDPSRFVLVEVYRTAEDQQKHRETAHFAKWRSVVMDMLVEPYTLVKYEGLFPAESVWLGDGQDRA